LQCFLINTNNLSRYLSRISLIILAKFFLSKNA
jgi:hypothetical protein